MSALTILNINLILRRCLNLKEIKNMKIIAVIAIALVTATSAFAHSGGTNSAGCHAGKKPYHCH
ncbi:MAG: hypothetical protein ACI84R_001061 [Candidatus Azotimanducaceae bacterium]|jgi:hypothetical protein